MSTGPPGRFAWPGLPPALRRLAPEPERPLRQLAYQSPLRDERVASLLGLALGISFTVCFATGLLSHVHQSPQPWLTLPARPAGLYRVTQSVHVATGIASIPLLLAKLWTVWPRLLTFPPVQNLTAVLERLSLVALVGGSLFMLFTGTANIVQWYPWLFGFRAAHFWVAWLTIGALITHIGAKLSITRAALGAGAPSITDANPATGDVAETPHDGLSRRGFIGVVAASSGVLTVATLGQTVRPLARVSVLAPRNPRVGPQGIPVNRSAADAGVLDLARAPDWRLRVEGQVSHPLTLTLDDVRSMSTRRAHLPITCVEGWSAQATWTGVVVRDLVARAGGRPGAEVRIESLEPKGAYTSSILNAKQAADRDALLATRLNGTDLDVEHGFPLRLIAPNRPGVLQTKWVTKVVVL